MKEAFNVCMNIVIWWFRDVSSKRNYKAQIINTQMQNFPFLVYRTRAVYFHNKKYNNNVVYNFVFYSATYIKWKHNSHRVMYVCMYVGT